LEVFMDKQSIDNITLEAMAKVGDRPEGMAVFENVFRDSLYLEKIPTDIPVVGQVCNFVPDELVLAAGALPVRVDSGDYVLARRGARQLHADVCCAVRSLAGLSLPRQKSKNILSAIDLLVIPTSCDAKKKLASSDYFDDELFMLQLPQSNQGEQSMRWWYAEVSRLVKKLQQLTKNKITKASLKGAIQLVNQRVDVARRLNEFRKSDIPPINGADSLLVMQAGFVTGIEWWLEQTESLLAELEQRKASGAGKRPRARILLTGSPILWPDFKIPTIISQLGADVVADEICSGTERLHHPCIVDEWTKEGMIQAAADRVLLPCTCPCFVGSDSRNQRLLELSQAYRVDGVVHHTQRLCQVYDMDSLAVSKLFKERSIPLLELVCEFSPEESGQLQNRIQAFIEMIER
jgi:benzoyl-CoA reductase/2-hydroxyglutaryl-CoA dehydratase subunit BcrC/BadD/HgdB